MTPGALGPLARPRAGSSDQKPRRQPHGLDAGTARRGSEPLQDVLVMLRLEAQGANLNARGRQAWGGSGSSRERPPLPVPPLEGQLPYGGEGAGCIWCSQGRGQREHPVPGWRQEVVCHPRPGSLSRTGPGGSFRPPGGRSTATSVAWVAGLLGTGPRRPRMSSGGPCPPSAPSSR